MKIADYAVYKEDKTPWTVDEVKLIVKSMGGTTKFTRLNNPTKRFVYYWDGNTYNWQQQNIKGKTKITFKEFLLLTKTIEFNIYKQLKQEKQMKTGKYLSLKINNGEANVRELIYQAYNTEINDPRPYVQDLISKEKDFFKDYSSFTRLRHYPIRIQH